MRRTAIVLSTLTAATVACRVRRTITGLADKLARVTQENDDLSRSNVRLCRENTELRQPYRLPADIASVTISTEFGTYKLGPASGYYSRSALGLILPNGYDERLAQAFNHMVRGFVMEPGGDPSLGGIGDEHALISVGKKRLEASGFMLPAPKMNSIAHHLRLALIEVHGIRPFEPVG